MGHLEAGLRRGGEGWEERQARVFFSKPTRRPQETETKCSCLHHLLHSAPLTSPAPGLSPLPPLAGLSQPAQPSPPTDRAGSLHAHQLWSPQEYKAFACWTPPIPRQREPCQ